MDCTAKKQIVSLAVMDNENGENAYKEFMKDIKKALKMRVKLTDIYPPVDDEF